MKRIVVFALGLTLFACNSDKSGQVEVKKEPVKINHRNEKGEKDGLFVSKTPDGKFRTQINYKNGKKHGESLDYYDSGKLRARINYNNGVKEGKALWYYDGEKVFRVNTYKDDLKHGLQEKFYKNGNKLSELEFHKEYPGVGLREWKENGDERILGNTIEVSKKGNMLSAKMSSGQSNVRFYYGELSEGKFLNFQLQDISGANGEAQLPKKDIKDLNNIVITARYKTYLKNDRIVTRTVKWSEI
ncbi:MAG: toxin-antitoxin system YwqK family antitoxin [Flavobacteriales bacterium]